MEKQRVQKFIQLAGIASRRRAEELIDQGRVKVNGEVIKLGTQCYQSDKIEVNNKIIKFNSNNKVYFILNKAKGFVTTKSDELGRKTIYELLKPQDRKSNLFSVGRLDKDTSGLIILTNDGDFNQEIIHPSKKISKEYIVTLDEPLDSKTHKELEKGIRLDNYQLKPCKIKKMKGNMYLVKIYEGRKRQIRRMFEEFDYYIHQLQRIRIGKLDLKDYNLKQGDYLKVSKQELIKKIFN